MSDAWQAPVGDLAETGPLGAGPASVPGMADPVEVGRVTIKELSGNLSGYALVGAGYFGLTFGVIVVCLLAIGIGIGLGAATNDETLLVVGGIAGFTVYTVVILAFAFVVYPLLTASLMRAIRIARSPGGGPVGGGSIVDRARVDMGRVVTFYLVSQCVVLLGFCMLYLPGFVAVAVSLLAMPIVVFEGLPTGRALSIAFQHLRANGKWHLLVWLLFILGALVLELTVVGLLFMWPAMVIYQVVAYDVAFGGKGAEAWAAEQT